MTLEEEVVKVGFLDRPLPEGVDLVKAIQLLKTQKNAVILAHYYVADEIQAIADFVGDSYALAQYSQKVNASMIVFCGVHFMAETAKILNPNSKVLLPDLNAGCSLADSAPEAEFIAFKNQYPDAVVVSYINCSSEIKAQSDYICTSSNAIEVVNAIPKDRCIIFAPDKNLGMYVQQVTGRELILWEIGRVLRQEINQVFFQYIDLEFLLRRNGQINIGIKCLLQPHQFLFQLLLLNFVDLVQNHNFFEFK